MKPSSVVQSKIHDQLNYYISSSKNDVLFKLTDFKCAERDLKKTV